MTEVLRNGVLWHDREGYGFYPVEADPRLVYDRAYFEKYVEYAEAPIGRALNRARVDLVERHLQDDILVDIGIGCGTFVTHRNELRPKAPTTYGYDVNLDGIEWLLRKNLWWDPWTIRPPSASCWDSLEHMADPTSFLARVKETLFVSLPVFEGPEHILRSKHFRPTEHFWYFTRAGFLRFAEERGFRPVEENAMEVEAGREDIGTFVLRRVR